MSGWNYLQIKVVPEAGLAIPTIGPGEYERAEAIARVQRMLDRAAIRHPPMSRVAGAWRRGKHDRVAFGPFVWTIYEHPQNGVRIAAVPVAEHLVEEIKHTGLRIELGPLPD